MSNAYRDVQRLINRRAVPTVGEVVAVRTGQMDVATRDGIRLIRIESTDATRYRTGDRVKVIADTARGRETPAPEIYVL